MSVTVKCTSENTIIIISAELTKIDRRNITKISITDFNNFKAEYYYLQYDKNSTKNNINYLQLLKNNDNDIIYLMIYEDTAIFKELGYSYCNNITDYIYNGEKYDFEVDITSALFKGNDNKCVFLDYEKKINSLYLQRRGISDGLLVTNGSIIYYKIYLGFFFNLSTTDYDDAKKKEHYRIKFRNTLNGRESQTCMLDLKFKPCEDPCEICTETKCYDKFYNEIDLEGRKILKSITVLFFVFIIALVASILITVFITLKKTRFSNGNNNINNPLV